MLCFYFLLNLTDRFQKVVELFGEDHDCLDHANDDFVNELVGDHTGDGFELHVGRGRP